MGEGGEMGVGMGRGGMGEGGGMGRGDGGKDGERGMGEGGRMGGASGHLIIFKLLTNFYSRSLYLPGYMQGYIYTPVVAGYWNVLYMGKLIDHNLMERTGKGKDRTPTEHVLNDIPVVIYNEAYIIIILIAIEYAWNDIAKKIEVNILIIWFKHILFQKK